MTDIQWDDELAQKLGIIFYRRRSEMGMSQEKVAQAAGISRNYYQLLERGLGDRAKGTRANPSIEALISLSEVLQLPLTEILRELEIR